MSQNDITQPAEPAWIGLNSELTYKMLEPNQNLRKIDILLDERRRNQPDAPYLNLGASIISLFDYQHSKYDSKFGYLMRHPTANNQIGKDVTEAVVHSFQLGLTGSVNSWLAFHGEILYDPQQNFGTGTITSIGRNQLQFRKGYVVIGDLNEFPLYVAIGKFDAPFGQMGSVSPFTNSTMWHAFGGLAYGAQVGADFGQLDINFMAVQGGAQFRALHTPVGDSTNVPSSLNNFVGDINYTTLLSDNISLQIGASYMHGSAYCQEFPVQHFEPCRDNNPAYTYYGSLELGDKLVIQGGFAKTLEVWPGTHNPNPPLDVFEASEVSSLSYGVRYTINPGDETVFSASGEFSNFRAGPEGAPWDRQNQIIAGLSAMVRNSSKLFLSLFRTEGYAPLNFISGSAPFAPFPPGQTHSVSDAFTHGVVLGAQLTL